MALKLLHVFSVGTTVFRGMRNLEPSHRICQFLRNFYVLEECCGIWYWPVIRGQIQHILASLLCGR